jgi:hypothetical protein
VSSTAALQVIAAAGLFDPSMALRTLLEPKLLVHHVLHDRITLEATFFTGKIPMRFIGTSWAYGQKAGRALQRCHMLSPSIDLFAVDCRATPVFLWMLVDIAREGSFNQMLEGLVR